jgi:PAS domain S-box-containing protein
MSREEVFYLVPYLLSLSLSLGIFLYTWRHRDVRGAKVYSWFVAGQTLTILGFILEMVSPNLQIKILWDKFQWLTISFLAIVPFLRFSIQFSEYEPRSPRLTWGFWLALPSLFTAFLLTDNIHHLIYRNPHLSADYPFPELHYDFTSITYLYAILYIYCVNLYGISLLIRRAFQPHNLYRSQYLIIAVGFLIPLVLSVFALLDIWIAPQRDASPFSLALGNLIVAWGLFRSGLFDIVPIAREHTVENIKDPVFVLDARNRVLDVNQAALKMLRQNTTQVVGRPSKEVFAKWPAIVSVLEYLDVERREIAIQEEGDTFYFDINISSIYNNRNQLMGRILAARDITRYKTLESGYRLLSAELEQRVRERTEELRHSAELYRTVVENQTEFIVRWKANGVRTFVNEAYCRYFGLTPEEALSSNFLTLVAEEDRRAMEEKISRLQSGAVDSETDIHRVIRPNGSVGWQEWTDLAIRDEAGNLVEFQSVGRDVTEQKQAEATILKQLAFDEMMTRLLARFATCAYNEVDSSIEIGLQEIAEFMDIDYADILILSPDRKTWKITYLWSASHLSPSIHSTQSIPTGQLLWSEIKLFQGEAIKIHTFDDYPAEAQIDRRFSESEGAKSILSVPIRGQEKLTFGCIDLISYTNQVNWSDSDVMHMKIIGDSIANLLERKRAEQNLAEAYDTTLEGWAKALELRDKETEGHSRRVTEATLTVARAMDFTDEELNQIRRGSILHDIGKMGIPDDILRKNGPLTEAERLIVKKHPTTAYELLKPISYLEKALDIPYCHHEKWDGSGYPRGLKGEEIPLAARIFAVVDVWDALSSDRSYRNAWPREEVAGYLVAESGKHFDPQIIDVFLQLMKKGEI